MIFGMPIKPTVKIDELNLAFISPRRALCAFQRADVDYGALVSAMLRQGHRGSLLVAPRQRRPDDEGAHAKARAKETLHAANLAMGGHWVGRGVEEKDVTLSGRRVVS